MATKKSKNSEFERLDDKSIEKAISILESKGTKKAACEALNIAYNTTRLDKLITTYKDRKVKELERRAEKRGKPANDQEIVFAISSYLEGSAVADIAASLYRSVPFVGNILEKYGVPKRALPHSYFTPRLIPEEAMADKFDIGEKVYSARYDSLATVKDEYRPGVYRVWLSSEKQQQYAYQPVYELASLKHLKSLGVNL